MSRLPASSGGGRRSRQQPEQAPIIETNSARYERPIYWRCRWLHGWAGVYPQYNHFVTRSIGLADYGAPEELQMHWALRIGSYLYELQVDDNMEITWRYVDETRSETWKSALPDRLVGETFATDAELASMAEGVASLMRNAEPGSSSPRAKYNFVRNNCHTFALGLLQASICCEIGEVDLSRSDALAGWRKMNAVSSHHGVTELYDSPSSYFRAVKDTCTGQLRKRHFEKLLDDYQSGAVMEEKYRQKGLIY